MSRQHARSTQPLLHLFTGYARSTAAATTKQAARWNSHQAVHRVTSWTASTRIPATCTRSLSTTTSSWAAAKKSQSKNAKQAQRPLKAAQPVKKPIEDNPPEPAPLTWRDYDPVGGMPLPNGELAQDEINAAFNSDTINVDTGNYILSVMHWRRHSGALIDVGLQFPADSGVDTDMAMQGLQYVRDLEPDLDESGAGQLWAEEEAQRVRKEYLDRAMKLGLYKRASEQETEPWEEESEQGTDYGRKKTGTSALQEMRKENEAKWELQQKETAIKEARNEQNTLHGLRGPLALSGGVQPPTPAAYAPVVQGSNGVAATSPSFKPWLQPVERKRWVKKYEEEAMRLKDTDLGATLSHLRRFGPSGAVVFLVLAGCLYLSDQYTPPPNSARIWPDIPPSQATLLALTSVMVLTFILGRLPPLWKFSNEYMVIVPNLPYAFSMIGAVFRHDTLSHLAGNMATLWLCGLILHEDIGRGSFLAIFLASAVGGSFVTFLFHALRKHWLVSIQGSSTGVFGVLAATIAIRPNGHIWIPVVDWELPFAAWTLLALIVFAEAVAVRSALLTGIDHVGHLGGAFTGLAAALYLRRQAKWEPLVPNKEPEAGEAEQHTEAVLTTGEQK